MLAAVLTSQPKPRQTVYGPLPPAGTYPPYPPRKAKGPKQKACLSDGGGWIGPNGEKWCQMPLDQAGPDDDIYYPPGTVQAIIDSGTQIVTPPGMTPFQQPPSDTSQVPDGVTVPTPPLFDTIPGDMVVEDSAVDGVVYDDGRRGPVPMRMIGRPSVTQQAFQPQNLMLILAGGALVWYMLRRAKRKKAT